MSWYRTYRPTTISGLHLTHTRERLAQMLQSGSIPHALLFTGPRGTGKTSAARIVAAVLNDPANAPAVVQTFGDQGKTSSKKITTASTSVAFVEPHRDDPLVKRIFQGTALCVVELDAASYRGIDDVRALKEQVYLVPQEGSVNVFILDEVHMFTNEAWNALLKILEEPPTRVVFVLATTEVAKVPETIVSRCQVVSFHRASTTELSTALEHIFAAECITCDPAALERIVRQASGSFRDAVKWAEAIAQGKQRVTLDDVVTVLGPAPLDPAEFIARVLQKKPEAVVAFFQQARELGIEPSIFYEDVLSYLHDQVVRAVSEPQTPQELTPKVGLFLLKAFHNLPVQQDLIPHLSLELAALDLVLRAQEQQPTKPPASPSQTSPASSPRAASKTTTDASPSPTASARSTLAISREQWGEFLPILQAESQALASLLQSCIWQGSEAGMITLSTTYPFHKDQIMAPRFASLFRTVTERHFGEPLALTVHKDAVQLIAHDQASAATPHLATVAAEVLL